MLERIRAPSNRERTRGNLGGMVHRIIDQELTYFPPVDQAEPDGLVAVGGDLRAERLVAAYEQGLYPLYAAGEPVRWYSPDPRFVLALDKLHVGTNLRRTIRQNLFTIRFDTAFEQVIHWCATIPRPNKPPAAWINPEMEKAYNHLHSLGFAHSVESWQDGNLVGGAYGLAIGSAFFSESMFKRVTGASKVAFAVLARTLIQKGFRFIDSQVESAHMTSFGAASWSRAHFLEELAVARQETLQPGSWADWKPAVQ